MENLGKIVSVLILVVLSPILGGFVFSKLWLWFIVPIFDKPSLTIIQSIGVLCVINFLTYGLKKDNNNKSENNSFTSKIFSAFFAAVCTYGFILLFGWIVTKFM